MGRIRTDSTQSQVRNVIRAANAAIRPVEIRDIIGLDGQAGNKKVKNAITALVKSGDVERIGYGKYGWKGERPAAKVAPKQNIVWRFCQIRTRKNRPFSARDAHEVTGVGLDTVKRYLTHLSKHGYASVTGEKKTAGSNAYLYLLKEDRVNGDGPVMRRNRHAVVTEAALDDIRADAIWIFRNAAIDAGAMQKMMEKCDRIRESVWAIRVENADRESGGKIHG